MDIQNLLAEEMKVLFLLIRLVWQMRQSQKAYFKNGRKPADLIESKRLEAQVDLELKRLLTFDENGQPSGIRLSVEAEPAQRRLI